MPFFKCEGKVTKEVTMYVEADSAEAARKKVRNGELEFECEGEVHDVDMDFGSLQKVKPEDLPRGYPKQ